MNLEHLQLLNFRTYSSLNLSFDTRLTFVIGNNAMGKTNLIEAISILSQGKSFRGAADRDMVRDDEKTYFIGSRYKRAGTSFKLEIGCEISGRSLKRKLKLNDKQLSGRSALIGNMASVMFSPSDIGIVEEGPATRRKFLDMVISTHDQEYLSNLMLYNRALKQRNSVLKKIKQNQAKVEDLGIWDRSLGELAIKVTATRKQFTVYFQEMFQDALKRISNQNDDLQIRLSLSAEGEDTDFQACLKKYARRDQALGYTTVGPHRHNIFFENRGRDITHFGSQGQKRSLVLSLRIAQFYYLKKNMGLSPILLIDDVIRELDAGRRAAFVGLLKECGQAIFTTPDLDGLEEFIEAKRSEISVFKITEHGIIEKL